MNRSLFFRLLKQTLLVDLAIFCLVGAIGWLAGWRSASEFGTALIWIGILSPAIGLASNFGGWNVSRSFGYQYTLSMTSKTMFERMQEELDDNPQSYEFTYLMIAASVLPFIIGIQLHNLV